MTHPREVDAVAAATAWAPMVGLSAVAGAGWCLGWWLVPPLVLFGPPLVCRFLGWLGAGGGAANSRAGRLWWLQQQCQMPFNRLPVLEEVLRLIPGLYALWLRLWGSRVSSFATFAPGVRVSDRHLIEVGPGAVIGTAAILGGHVVVRDEVGTWRITVGVVRIGAGAVVGAGAVLAPDSTVAPGAILPASGRVPPGRTWDRR